MFARPLHLRLAMARVVALVLRLKTRLLGALSKRSSLDAFVILLGTRKSDESLLADEGERLELRLQGQLY